MEDDRRCSRWQGICRQDGTATAAVDALFDAGV
jgi:hypothetical protein